MDLDSSRVLVVSRDRVGQDISVEGKIVVAANARANTRLTFRIMPS